MVPTSTGKTGEPGKLDSNFSQNTGKVLNNFYFNFSMILNLNVFIFFELLNKMLKKYWKWQNAV